MKKFIAWVLRLCCLAVIGVAAYTLVQCLLHINDDHSAAAIMANAQTAQVSASSESSQLTDSVLDTSSGVEEEPNVALSADGTATVNHNTITVTASFSNIENSILADLYWYLDGELVSQSSENLLVDGSTMTYKAQVDPETVDAETVQVELQVEFSGKRTTADTEIPVEQPENSVVIQTEEITVTCIQDCSIYTSGDLSEDTGEIMWEGETGLLLDYQTNSSGLSALHLQFPDGTDGWVSARRNSITDEDCTTDQDYTEQQKTEFVNSMGYDSDTGYLVWVSRYTQKVNVFTGYKGSWELAESFDCATGINETATSTGIFTYSMLKDRWDLGKTYVEPVLIFNGGEAFTSQPYDVDTDEIVDDTIGKPASGGSVWLQADDIAWMADNLPVNSTVVVY
jgi:hypothetical protein